MHILFSFLIIAFGTLHTLFGMDVEPTAPAALTQQWLNLAYDFHTGKLSTHFKSLFADVQGIIMAQVHPRQTIDELASNHFIVVRELTVPHIIASWDMKGDDFVYYTKKGLEQLVLIEESLDKIFSGTDIEQKEALFKRLPHALREEYNALLLLKELPGISEKLHLIEHLSETLVNTQHQPEVAVSMIQQIFAPVGGYKQECKELKERLVQIYVMRA
jgi:hypothetical protein